MTKFVNTSAPHTGTWIRERRVKTAIVPGFLLPHVLNAQTKISVFAYVQRGCIYIYTYMIYVHICAQKLTWHICYDAYGLTRSWRKVAVYLHVRQHVTGNMVDLGLRYAAMLQARDVGQIRKCVK